MTKVSSLHFNAANLTLIAVACHSRLKPCVKPRCAAYSDQIQACHGLRCASRQPWSFFVVEGFKDVRIRTWKTDFRGPVLIHASQKMDGIYLEDRPMLRREGVPDFMTDTLTDGNCQPGGIVGIAELVDCVSKSKSPWFTGPYGFVFKNPIRLPFVAYKGKLRFFKSFKRSGGSMGKWWAKTPIRHTGNGFKR